MLRSGVRWERQRGASGRGNIVGQDSCRLQASQGTLGPLSASARLRRWWLLCILMCLAANERHRCVARATQFPCRCTQKLPSFFHCSLPKPSRATGLVSPLHRCPASHPTRYGSLQRTEPVRHDEPIRHHFQPFIYHSYTRQYSINSVSLLSATPLPV